MKMWLILRMDLKDRACRVVHLLLCYRFHATFCTIQSKKNTRVSPFFLTASDENWVGPGNGTTFLK